MKAPERIAGQDALTVTFDGLNLEGTIKLELFYRDVFNRMVITPRCTHTAHTQTHPHSNFLGGDVRVLVSHIIRRPRGRVGI